VHETSYPPQKKSLTLLFLLLAVVSLIAAPVTFYQQEETLTWKEGVATIANGEIVDRPGSSRDKYEPMVTYEYTVGGKTYVANRIAIVSKVYNTKGTADAVLKKYAVGRQVPVFYDPARPSRAVLERGGSLFLPLAAGFGGLLMLLFAFLEHRSRKKATPAYDEKTAARLKEQERARHEEKGEQAAGEQAGGERTVKEQTPAALINDEDQARKLAFKIIEGLADAIRGDPDFLRVARGSFKAQVVEELHWVFQDACEEMRI